MSIAKPKIASFIPPKRVLMGPGPSDVPQRILEHALLGGDLRREIDVLHGAAAADAEVRAARRDPAGAGCSTSVATASS